MCWKIKDISLLNILVTMSVNELNKKIQTTINMPKIQIKFVQDTQHENSSKLIKNIDLKSKICINIFKYLFNIRKCNYKNCNAIRCSLDFP